MTLAEGFFFFETYSVETILNNEKLIAQKFNRNFWLLSLKKKRRFCLSRLFSPKHVKSRKLQLTSKYF